MIRRMLQKSLFLFHRDLRLPDNTALQVALTASASVIPVFIFAPEQIDPKKNKYFSNAAVQFMCESLTELHNASSNKLQFFHGNTIDVLTQIHKTSPFQAIYQNKDLTHYAQQRDAKIEQWCKLQGIEFHNIEDYDLFPSSEGLVPSSGKPYTILAQYYARYLKDLKVRKPIARVSLDKLVAPTGFKYVHAYVDPKDIDQYFKKDDGVVVRGGRTHALYKLKHLSTYKNYGKTRDFPADDDGTTKLSAYIKFGCVSIREVYWHCVNTFHTRDHPLIRELIFRSFYYRLYSSHPKQQRGEATMYAVDERIPWKYSKQLLHAWQTGTTGFPLVDAGMRQLATIHWQHNRVRMLTASVLTRYLLIDWREGERYFATQLVDYDPISNVAGWQWGASVGYDNAQTMFRAPMNPMIQSKKFDPDALYIKKWVPELKDIPASDIHRWDEEKIRAKHPTVTYPAPIVDRKDTSARAMKLWKSAAKFSKT